MEEPPVILTKPKRKSKDDASPDGDSKKKGPRSLTNMTKLRTEIQAGENAEKLKKTFTSLFNPAIWKTYQNLFNAAIREPVTLAGDVALKVPSTTQKFWADTSTPVLGTRGAVIIAPTGTGKSEMIGLIAESRLYYGRTKSPPWKNPESPTPIDEIPHQIFIVTRASLKKDLQSKITSAMQTRSVTELKENITKYGGSVREKTIPFSPEINILSYKEFSNMLEAKNINGRRWWAGMPLRRDGDKAQVEEFYKPPEMSAIEHRRWLSKTAYTELNKKEWGNFEALESISFNDGKCTLKYIYANSIDVGDERTNFNSYWTMFLTRKQIADKFTVKSFIPTKEADNKYSLTIKISYKGGNELRSKTILREAFDTQTDCWIKGMAAQEQIEGVVGELLFKLTYSFTDKTVEAIKAFVKQFIEKLDNDATPLAEIGDQIGGISPAFTIDVYEIDVPKTRKGHSKPVSGQLVITMKTSMVNIIFAEAYIDQNNEYEEFKESNPSVKYQIDGIPVMPPPIDKNGNPISPWPSSLNTFAQDNGFELFKNEFPAESAKYLNRRSPRFGHKYTMNYRDDKGPKPTLLPTVGLTNTDEENPEPETFHPLDNCTVIFDEADMLLNKQSLKAGEIPSTSLIFQALSDADCTTYFFSATIPFFAGLAFIEALQPSLYLDLRMKLSGETPYTCPSTPYYEKHPELLDYRNLSATAMNNITKELFKVKLIKDKVVFSEEPLGIVLKSRSFSCVSWSPPIEQQREYFATIDSSNYAINVTFSNEQEKFLKGLLERNIKTLTKNPYKLLNHFNYFNLVTEPSPNDSPDVYRMQIPPYLRPSSSEFDKELSNVRRILLDGSCPAIPAVLTKMRTVDMENELANPLGRTVIISHAKDDRYGAELIAAALRAVGYKWKRVAVNNLSESQHKERKQYIKRGETVPNNLLLVKFTDQDHPIQHHDDFGPVANRIQKSSFIVYSTTITGGPDGFGEVTVKSLSERVSKSGYHTFYEGNAFLESVQNGALNRKGSPDDNIWKAKRDLVRQIDGKVIYFWPGSANIIEEEDSAFKRVKRINDQFRSVKEWFFFILTKKTNDNPYIRLRFPWLDNNDLSDNEKLKQMRMFFSVDKITGNVKEDMSRLYANSTNTSKTKTNEIGVVVVGGEFLSGIDIFSATTVIKMDAPPTRELAVQGTGRANRRGGMAAFDWNNWIIHEYGVQWNWNLPEITYNALNDEVSLLDDGDGFDEDDEDEEPEVVPNETLVGKFERKITNLKNRLEEKRKASIAYQRVLKRLKNAEQRLEEIKMPGNIDSKIAEYRFAVLTTLDSQTNILNAQSMTETGLAGRNLLPHEILRKLIFKDEIVEVYNQFGQGKFVDWALDYGSYTRPQELNEMHTTDITPEYIEKCTPTGFYLSWRHASANFLPDTSSATNSTELESQITQLETALIAIKGAGLPTENVEKRIKEYKEELEAMGNIDLLAVNWGKFDKDFKENPQNLLEGNAFFEIVRNASDDRLFVLIDNKALELINSRLFNKDAPPTLQWLVENKIAVWRIHLPISSVKKLDDGTEKGVLLPKRPFAAKGSRKPKQPTEEGKKSKKRTASENKPAKRAKKVIAIDYRLEPYQVFGKDDTTNETARKSLFPKKVYSYDTAFNTFFDLRVMDKEHVAIQKSLIDRAKQLGAYIGLFKEFEFSWKELYALFYEVTDDIEKMQENAKQLRTAFGYLMIDGMVDWNTAAPFFYGVCKTLQPLLGERIKPKTCAIFTGLLYRNALNDLTKTTRMVFKENFVGNPTEFKIESGELGALRDFLYVSALYSTTTDNPTEKTATLEEMFKYIREVLGLDAKKTAPVWNVLVGLVPFTIDNFHSQISEYTTQRFKFIWDELEDYPTFLNDLKNIPLQKRREYSLKKFDPARYNFLRVFGIPVELYFTYGTLKRTLKHSTNLDIIKDLLVYAKSLDIDEKSALRQLKKYANTEFDEFDVVTFKATLESNWVIITTIPPNTYQYNRKSSQIQRVAFNEEINVDELFYDYQFKGAQIKDEEFLKSQIGKAFRDKLSEVIDLKMKTSLANAILNYGTFDDINNVVKLLKRSKVEPKKSHFEGSHILRDLDAFVQRLFDGNNTYELPADFALTTPIMLLGKIQDKADVERFSRFKKKMGVVASHRTIFENALTGTQLRGRELWVEINNEIKKHLDSVLLEDFPETIVITMKHADPLCTLCLESNCDCD
jgi:hypothetical protein